MIAYKCPACKTKNKAAAEFAGLKAKCLQCGTTFRIPSPAGPGTGDDIDTLAAQQPSRSYAKLPALPPESDRIPGDGIDTDLDVLPPVPPRAIKPRPKWHLPAAIGVVVALAGVGYGLFGMSPPPPVPKKAPPPPTDDDEAPATPPAATPTGTAAATPAVATPPVAVPPVAPRVIPGPARGDDGRPPVAEYVANRDDANAKYAGKLLEIQGVCLSSRNGRVVFVNNNDLGEDVASGVTAFVPGLAPRPDGFANLVAAAAGTAAVAARSPADPDPALTPRTNRPVTLRGKYRPNPEVAELVEAELVSLQAPADAKYLGRRLTLAAHSMRLSKSPIIRPAPSRFT